MSPVHAAISQLVQRQFVTLEKKGNTAIKKALQLAKKQGFEICCIPDVGGWLTYEPYAKKEGFTIVHLETIDGIIDPRELILAPKSVLLIHSLAGYHKKQDCAALKKVCERDNALFIEDICGTISYPAFGDIILGSFGKAKPINFGTGGFLATNNKEWYEFFKQSEIELNDPQLLQKIMSVKKRLHYLYAKRDNLSKLLLQLGFCAHADEFGLVLIVEYNTESDLEKLTQFCEEEQVEYELCPREIRSSKKAISIEVKRLTE